jgi:predicted transcriptional regulator
VSTAPESPKSVDGSNAGLPASTRDALVDIIRARPGINKSGLCESSNLAWGTIHYHVELLRRQGRIQVVETGWESLHFVGLLAPHEMAWIAALREQQARLVLERLDDGEARRAGELAQAMGLSRKVIRRHLTVLGDAGIVEKRGYRQALYRLRTEARGLLGSKRETP